MSAGAELPKRSPEGEPFGLRDHWCGSLRLADSGRSVRLCGWVAKVRAHGSHLRFVDVRDRSGVVQCVVDTDVDLRSEYVVSVSGTVEARPEGTGNENLPTGEVEVRNCVVEILSKAEPPPFQLDERAEVDEATRLRYRYVDLRRGRMAANLRLRAAVMSALRRSMESQGFVEVETPLLWTPTPEGAREFAVPSRLHHGSFYVLPQSPQIAKQLLMVGGVDRYYQMAKCLRDEDLRADRQFEFTQLDVEMSFATQQDVMAVVSDAVLGAASTATEWAAGGGSAGDVPPVTTLTWREAMDRYGTDKPDVRFGMELVDLTAAVGGSGVGALAAPCVKAIRVPGGAGASRSRLDWLTARARELGAKGLAWFRVVPDDAGNGSGGGLNLDSPLARHMSPQVVSDVISLCAAQEGDLLLAVAGPVATARGVMGQLRLDLGRPPLSEGSPRYVWITDFPLFEEAPDGAAVPAHHPFTMPHPDDLAMLESDPLSVRSQSYDLVLNGWELGSGSIRIHDRELQERIFAALHMSPDEAQARFGFLLDAFRYGAPPHGGFAVGVDRLVAILAGEENIREVIAFPKTQSGADPMTGAPKELTPSALRDLGISVSSPPSPKSAPASSGGTPGSGPAPA